MRSRLFNRFSLIIGTFTVIAAAVTVLPLRGALAGPLGDFNVLTFGDFSAPSSDVEGRLYAGGNVSLSSFSVGDKLQGGLVGGDSLVAGSNLSFTSGAVYHGNIKVGGSAAGVSSSVAWGTINTADLSAATNVVVPGIADGTEVVINVTGANAYMSGGLDQFFERNRENVLFNFVDAETLNLGSIGVQGSILATGADITTQWGVVWGQVVAESWDGPT
jgi:hypothetical protein